MKIINRIRYLLCKHLITVAEMATTEGDPWHGMWTSKVVCIDCGKVLRTRTHRW